MPAHEIDNDRGIEIASAEYEASEPPCEKLAWETRVMLVVPRDTAVQFACSLAATMEMSPVPGWIVDLRVVHLSGIWPQVYQAYLQAKILPEMGTQEGSREKKPRKAA